MPANTNHSSLETAREKLRPLGTHTAVGHLQKFNKWKEVPFLRENKGMAPPFIISVGSRVRVLQAPSLIGLREFSFIDLEAKEKFGLSDFGRVSICIGIAESKGKLLPIMVAESQMGCPAAQINVKELLYYANPSGYAFSGGYLPSDGIYIIRAGTCAGVNSFDPEKHQMQIGDIAIADSSIGSIGAIIQSCLGTLHFSGKSIIKQVQARMDERAEKARRAAMYGICAEEALEDLKTRAAISLVQVLSENARKLGIGNSVGPNFTKDSLYAELGEEEFAHLRDAGGVISTEMEQMALDALAAEFSNAGIPVQSALIAAVIGAIPGKSFPETEEEQEAAAAAEKNALILAKEALGQIASGF